MGTLNKLPVPIWAESMVNNYRRSQKIRNHITDEMIFARVQECSGMEQEDIEASVGDLLTDVLQAEIAAEEQDNAG